MQCLTYFNPLKLLLLREYKDPSHEDPKSYKFCVRVCVSFLDGVILVDQEYVKDQKGKNIQTNTGK